jgi:hypothetical protein
MDDALDSRGCGETAPSGGLRKARDRESQQHRDVARDADWKHERLVDMIVFEPFP